MDGSLAANIYGILPVLPWETIPNVVTEVVTFAIYIFDSLFLRTVPTNSKVYKCGLLTIWEKQILTNVIEIQKEIWG